MKDIVALLDQPDTTVAVVGATDDPGKYGYIIYRDLKRKGYTVFPVNRSRDTVDGDQAYRSLRDLPQTPTIVNVVVPPSQTLLVVRHCLELGIGNVWLQPGAESPEVLEVLQTNGFNYLANACIMVQSRLAHR
ncbi:MAG TPA: CoA-binding protein [Vicinamibacteria bacterium]|nr:CoA-binding protein [Vicinamibacteria bacterium]